MSTTASQRKAKQVPVSFILRLTVSDQGQPLHTEIEPSERTLKEIGPREPGRFSGLDGQKLAAYIKECIGATVPPALMAVRLAPPTPESPEQAISLSVTDVKVFRKEMPGVMALVLDSNKPFAVQVHSRFGGLDDASFKAQQLSFQVKVFAQKVSDGTSRLLTHYSAHLARDETESVSQVDIPGLPSGPYCLLTLVSLHEPVTRLGYYKGPIIRIVDA